MFNSELLVYQAGYLEISQNGPPNHPTGGSRAPRLPTSALRANPHRGAVFRIHQPCPWLGMRILGDDLWKKSEKMWKNPTDHNHTPWKVLDLKQLNSVICVAGVAVGIKLEEMGITPKWHLVVVKIECALAWLMPMTTIISPRWENANLTGEVEYPKATRRVIHDPSWPFNQGGCSNLQNWPWTLRSHQSSNFGITSQQLPSDPVQCGKPNHHPQKKNGDHLVFCEHAWIPQYGANFSYPANRNQL